MDLHVFLQDIHRDAWLLACGNVRFDERPFLLDFVGAPGGMPTLMVRLRGLTPPESWRNGGSDLVRVRLAPAVRKIDPETGRSLEIPLIGRARSEDWVVQIFERNGMTLRIHRWEEACYMLGRDAARDAAIPSVLLTGVVGFSDVGLAAKAYAEGIGRHRGFGFGTLVSMGARDPREVRAPLPLMHGAMAA